MDTPPEPFEALRQLVDASATPKQRALDLGKALKAIPDLQKWLRHAREMTVAEMRDEGMSHADVAKVLGISRARAQQIAEGRTTGKRADPGPESSTPALEPNPPL